MSSSEILSQVESLASRPFNIMDTKPLTQMNARALPLIHIYEITKRSTVHVCIIGCVVGGVGPQGHIALSLYYTLS